MITLSNMQVINDGEGVSDPVVGVSKHAGLYSVIEEHSEGNRPKELTRPSQIGKHDYLCCQYCCLQCDTSLDQ